MTREFDKIDNLAGEDFEAYMDEFFSVMEISEEQKDKRKEVAREVRNSLLFLFILCFETLRNGYDDYAFILTQFYDEFYNIATKYSRDDEYIRQYADRVSADIFAVTMLHQEPLDREENFYLSDERAGIVAVNEANSIMNYDEFADAIENGYAMKTWRTMEDKWVRKTHRELNGKTIPLDEYFQVGDSELLFPRDEVNCSNLADISNCRCSLTFS